MKRHEMRRTAIAIVAGAAVLLSVATATAQDVSETDRATSDELLEAASERLDEEVESEEEREVESTLEDETDVSRDEYEAAQDQRSPEELERLQRELEEQNAEMIQQLDEIIASSPQSPQRPEWMFQKAELTWDLRNMEYIRARNEYNACMDAVYEGTAEEGSCGEEPQPDYSEAQDIYEEILQQFPDYDRLDEVLYRLGSGLLEAGEGPQAVNYLNRLVEEYPNSTYIADAYLSLGDYFFQEHMTGAAKDNYTAVLDYDDYQNYDYALYQLGWTNYNMGEHRDSAERFKQVIERAEDDSNWGLLPDRAANDLMLALAELPDGWIEARDYFIEMRDVEFAYQQMETMAQHLEAQGKTEDMIALYDWFLEERPDHPDLPNWVDAITQAYRDIDFDTYEDRTVEYVDYLHPDHTWYRQNEDNEDALARADRWVENNLSRLGTHYHSQAQENDDLDQYAQAAEYYQQFIDRFPDHHVSFDMTFFLGEIYLHHLERFEDAAEQYQHVVDLFNEDNVPEEADEEDVGELVRDAAHKVVISYNNLVRENHPESVLVDMAERAGEDPEMTAEGIDEVTDEGGDPEPVEREELLEWEERFVTASDQFSEMYPEDDATPTVDYVAAEIYRDRGHYDSCIPRYENIIEHAPGHTYASFAGNSLLEANYRLEDWDEVERWARHLKENEIFDVTPEESLNSAIAYAINQRAIELQDDDRHEEASDELLRLAEEFPDSDLASGALFNAAAIYERGDQVNDAVEVYNRVVDEYPDSDQAPEALNVLGLIHEARTDFDRAADYFVRLGEEQYRDTEWAPDAVFNAGRLREAMEHWDEAIETYERYLEYFRDEVDDVQEVEYNLAYLEQERENWEGSRERLQQYLEDWGEDVPLYEQVEIHAELGRIAQRLEPDDWEAANEHYTETIELWQNDEAWQDEFGDEWESYKREMRHDAAEARFEQTERVFEDFKDVELSFPPDELAELAQEKAEFQNQAEEMYREVISMGSPRWVAASAYRIGQSYQDFAESLFNLPMPEELTPDQEFEYQISVDELAQPLEEQALDAFANALNLALQYQAYNEWSSRSAAEISELESASYPITEQDGVEVEHNRVEFFSPEPVTDLGVVSERASERFERMKPDEGPVLDPDHPDYDPTLDPDSPQYVPPEGEGGEGGSGGSADASQQRDEEPTAQTLVELAR